MILDSQGIFSDAQAIVASVDSTNHVDLKVARDIGPGIPIPILIQIVEAFNLLTTLEVILEVDTENTFGSPKTVATSGAIALADLILGKRLNPMFVPDGTDQRFLQIRYVVVGVAPTAGKVTAGFSGGAQTNVENM